MTTISENVGGTITATNFIGPGTGLTGLIRSQLAAGTANWVVINDPSGLLSQEAQLAPVRGGTGTDTSAVTGIAEVTAGTWSFPAYLTANKGGTGIDTSSATGVPTISAGTWSTASTLSPTYGGTGQNFSGVGAGPFLVQIVSGVFSATVTYSSAATPNAVVQRDGSGNTAVNSLATPTITSTANITLTPATGNVILGTAVLQQNPTGISGSSTFSATASVATTNATATTIYSLATTAGTNGCVVGIRGLISCGVAAASGATAYYAFLVKGKNTAGTMTASAIAQSTAIVDSPLSATAISATVTGATINIQVTGVASTNINWCGRFLVTSQTY